ncbi:MAG TPA: protein kinase [Gemmatimonadales bacterium]|nr:protein kinase [Gemmatimonadales bacterium]
MPELFDALAAHLTGRYTLERQIGEGGMATVFLAQDVKHHRPVAIKVLKPDLAATIGTERFLREIELAAGLQHPHIVPVYDSGAAGSHLYYVMPFIEGESLRDRLERDGRIPLAEALRLTGEAASALSYAHQHGIVHRDIKPENILLSGGHAVVTDFGIARAATRPAADARLTGIGIAIGTPAYMSPEQATGSEDVDGRADEYALACVFYEMMTGKQPFTGPNVQAVITRHITGPRPKMSGSGEQVAPGPVAAKFDVVLAKALAADPAERYDSVTGFSSALLAAAESGRTGVPRWVLGAAAALIVVAAGAGWFLAPRRSVVKGAERIAVMPFSVTGGDPLLGEGMVDLLSTNLGSVGGVQTADPRSILVQVKKHGGAAALDLEGALAVGRAVDAGAVLLGSVVTAGDQVRLSATLYGADGASLAQAQTSGAADAVLPLVDSLSVALVREIWKSREPVPSLNVAGLTTGSLVALRHYLTAEQFYRRAEWDSSIAAFTRATDADTTFALAYYRLAMALGWRGGFGSDANQAIETANRLSDRLPARERSLVRAYRLFQHSDPSAADSMRAFLATHPHDADAWNLLGESQYHSREIFPRAPAELYAPFDSVLAIDPSLTPSLIHPMEIALFSHDSARYQRYLDLARAGAGADERATFETMQQVGFGRNVTDSLLRSLSTPNQGLIFSALSGTYHDPTVTPGLVRRHAAAFMARTPPGPRRDEMEALLAGAYLGLGQFDSVAAIGRTMAGRGSQMGMFLQIVPATYGLLPAPAQKVMKERMLAVAERQPSAYPRMITVTLALQDGDVALARRLLAPMLRADTMALAEDARFLRPMFIAQEGWATILSGDTTAGLARMRQGLGGLVGKLGYPMKDPLRFQYAQTLIQRPASRAEGVTWLEWGFTDSPTMNGLAQLALGRAREAAGDRAGALDAYTQFTRLWADADSSQQARVGEARDAIRRLSAEPGAGR